MKSEAELQKAHDLFVAIITGEIGLSNLPPEALRNIVVSTDVLCWALDHDHNSTFACNLRQVREQIAAAGYVEHEGELPGGN